MNLASAQPGGSAVPVVTWPAHASRVGSFPELVRISERQQTLVVAPLHLAEHDRLALAALTQTTPAFEFSRETSHAGETLEVALPWMEGHPGAEVWLKHAHELVGLFADLFETERVGARLTLSNKPMCPRFHVDDVVCRLVVTFSGTASEFLANDDVRRRLLGAKESAVERAGAQVHSLEPLEVGLFKGEAWPENRGNGVVHRSPPGDGRRLVMTLDLL